MSKKKTNSVQLNQGLGGEHMSLQNFPNKSQPPMAVGLIVSMNLLLATPKRRSICCAPKYQQETDYYYFHVNRFERLARVPASARRIESSCTQIFIYFIIAPSVLLAPPHTSGDNSGCMCARRWINSREMWTEFIFRSSRRWARAVECIVALDVHYVVRRACTASHKTTIIRADRKFVKG